MLNIEFEDQTYELSEEITGADYLKLREILVKANKDIEVESREALRLHLELVKRAEEEGVDPPEADIPTPDMTEYGLANIVMRLKSWSLDGDITRESILALDSAHYQILHWEVLRLDGDENKRASAFLVTRLPASRQWARDSQPNWSIWTRGLGAPKTRIRSRSYCF